MKKEVFRRAQVVGWSDTMKPATSSPKFINKVCKTFRLNIPNMEGCFFVFEYREAPNGSNDWFLITDYSFINLESPDKLIDYFQDIDNLEHITFEQFVDEIYIRYYWV